MSDVADIVYIMDMVVAKLNAASKFNRLIVHSP